MSLQIRYNSATEVADTVTVRQGVRFSMAAEEGAVATSTIVVDDVAGTLDYVGLRRIYAYETAAQAHNQMIFNGYIQDRTIGRGPEENDAGELLGAARRWTINVADTNSLLSRRIITGADGNRPAETDIARIQWLLDSNDSYLSNPMDTWENPSPYIETDGPVDMDAADLRGQTAHDVLNDCAQRSGKNWFAFYYEAADSVPPTNNGSIALFYDFDYSTAYSSTLRLSNVLADVDNSTTFAVFPDLELARDPTRVYSGIYLTYSGGSLYQQSTVVENLFQRRDAAVSNQNVKTSAKATALATRYLADAQTEDDRLSCRFQVAKQYVNDLREGQRFQAKFSHLGSDYSTYQWWRCLRRTVTHLTDEMYEISIEATPIAPPVTIVQQISGRVGDAGSITMTFPDGPATAGNLLVAVVRKRDSAGTTIPELLTLDNLVSGRVVTFTSWGEVEVGGGIFGTNRSKVMYATAVGDEQNFCTSYNKLQYTIYEISGGTAAGAEVLSATFQTASTGKSLSAFTTAGDGDLQVAGFLWDNAATGSTAGTGWTIDYETNSYDGYSPAGLAMHSDNTGPTATISGPSYEWGGVAVNIPQA